MNHDDQKKMDCGVEILNIFLMVDATPKDAYEIRDKYWAFSLDVDRISRVLSNLYKKGYIERTVCPEGSCKYSYFIRSDISKEMLLLSTCAKKGISDDCIPKGVISEKTKIE
jgi:predicted transcriptional regulator